MPDAAPQLRVAAATLRGRLAELAGARLGATPDQVLLSDGVARIGAGADPRAAGGIPYGDLVRGLRRLDVVSTPSAPTPPAAWRLAGRPTVNGGGAEIVTGRRRYTSDLHLPGMLHGRILFPPAYGAKLVRADLARARAWPEVVVLQEADFVGVAAPDLLQARSALRAIEVEWTLSPSQPTEGELVAYLERHRDEDPDAWDVVRVRTGEPGKAFATAATTLKGRYTAAYIAHTPLETHATVAAWSPDGRLSIWVGAQTPFRVRETVARALGLPVEKVRVRVPPTGAGFGGKHAGELATAAARLARASGRPVRIVYTREEEFQQGYFRPFAAIDLAAGLDGEGRLVAWDHRVLNAGGAGARSPYGVAHASIESVPCASPLPQGPYRALAATANNFARESLMDEVAHRAGADPVAYRLQALQDERLRAVLRAVADRVGWAPSDGPPRAPGRGRGIAVGLEKGGRVATYAEVAVDEGHRVEVRRLVTGFECGAIVHPANLRSQVEGGTIMALGGALFEAVRFDRGRVLNPRLSMYRVPRLRDVPDLEVLLLDRKDLPSEGAGEAPLIAVAPAVANAIFNATGQRIRSMPMVPDGILPPPAP